MFKGNCSNRGIRTLFISSNLDIEKTNVSLSVLIFPQPKVAFISSKAFWSSLCKAILNLNSNPIIFPLLSLRTRIKKLDSASLIPTNHSINPSSIFGRRVVSSPSELRSEEKTGELELTPPSGKLGSCV